MRYKVELIERHRGVWEVDAESEEDAINYAIENCVVEYECLVESKATIIDN